MKRGRLSTLDQPDPVAAGSRMKQMTSARAGDRGRSAPGRRKARNQPQTLRKVLRLS
jgi:hypothetical protein